MSTRLAETFLRCKEAGGAALVTYVMGGDPDLKTSQAMALACVEGGADILEIGIPFSDPIADGPTIQRAAERALLKKTSLKDCLALAKAVRGKTSAPIVLMGYVNPVLAYGEQGFFEDCAKSGVDAVILPDLPPEEAENICRLAEASGVKTVFLLAPTSTDARCQAACKLATGFVYFVSVTGVTGARTELPADLTARLDRVRAMSQVPLVVGFGISKPEQARSLASHADGIVVGSAIVSRIAEGGGARAASERVRRFVHGLKRAVQP